VLITQNYLAGFWHRYPGIEEYGVFMRILIVGGTSSLGQALRPVLSAFADVITAGRTGCDVHLDLNDQIEKIKVPQDIDCVINTAAHFGGNNFEEMFLAESVNVVGVLKLCHVCCNARVKHFVAISSTSAYLSPASHYYSIYSLTKKHADEIAQLFCSSFNLACTILRPSQIYGNENIFQKHQPFLYSAIDKAERGEDISIYGTNDALRNYIHIEDLTKIISLVIKKRIEGLFACTHDIDVSFSHIAKVAIDVFDSKGKVKFIKDMPVIPNNVFDKDDSLYKLINYFPQISIEEGIRKIAAYRLSQS
jgi:nucleoside-diphosphate-sugar epimerase